MQTAFIIPQPQKCSVSEVGAGLISLHHWELQVHSAWETPLAGVFQSLASEMRRIQPGDTAGQVAIRCCVRKAEKLTGEAYRLRFDGQFLEIGAGDVRGAALALQSLRCLLRTTGGLPRRMEIDDAPVLPRRGFMLDISRCRVPTRAFLMDLVDVLALLKFNELQLYTEHTFAFAEHPRVWGMSSPLTAADIRWLDDLCAAHFIQLIPNLNSLGHLDRWLRHAPYRFLAECPDGLTLPNGRVLPFGTTLRPGEEANGFLQSLYEEYLPLFHHSAEFNAGCDEPWELGMGASAVIAAQRGKQALYLDHLQEVHRLLSQHGKRLQFWADIVLEHPELIPQLPPGCLGLLWGYEADHPFEANCEAFARAEIPFLLVPGTSTWNSLGGRFDTARLNIRRALQAAREFGAEGALLTDWGDNGHHQPWSVTLPPLFLFAAGAWNPPSLGSFDLETALHQLIPSIESREVARALLQLGKTPRCFPKKIHNTHLLNRLFFAGQSDLPGLIQGNDPAAFTKAWQYLEDIRQILPSSPDLVSREINCAAGLLQVAAGRALLALEASPFTRDQLATSLTRLIGEFEELWLQRSRPGGLHESSLYLRRTLETLC